MFWTGTRCLNCLLHCNSENGQDVRAPSPKGGLSKRRKAQFCAFMRSTNVCHSPSLTSGGMRGSSICIMCNPNTFARAYSPGFAPHLAAGYHFCNLQLRWKVCQNDADRRRKLKLGKQSNNLWDARAGKRTSSSGCSGVRLCPSSARAGRNSPWPGG